MDQEGSQHDQELSSQGVSLDLVQEGIIAPSTVTTTSFALNCHSPQPQPSLHLEDDLHNHGNLRIEDYNQPIYIYPMAKSDLRVQDDTLFSLREKVDEFLTSDREVMLIIGDSGAGKSTFSRHLEHQLWTSYRTSDPIPLHIHLPTIRDPEDDMITKQLQMYNFKDEQIQIMKQNRKFVLICDGYDESQLTTNLHKANRLNQCGQWRAKMIISCRSQFLGPNYVDRFAPQGRDHYQLSDPSLFQQAVLVPFSIKQVEDYVTRYVSLEERPWTTNDYVHTLTTIPNLMDLVKSPFLLTLSLEFLPDITRGQRDLSSITITRVQLYDYFVKQWLRVSLRRLCGSALSKEDQAILCQLVDAGFSTLGANYSTRLAAAIYDSHDGNPSVSYVHLEDRNTWKVIFFGLHPEVRLLRESSPLTRTGNIYRFIHRSMLEYFFSCNIYSPPVRAGEDFDAQDEIATTSTVILSADCPLFQRDLLKEPSVIWFLCDRVILDSTFKHKLRAIIDQSRTDTSVITAATNAITILVRAGVSFNGADLRSVSIPGADLSNGQFDSAQFQGADLTGVDLERTWLRQANFSSANLENINFGELPYLEFERGVVACCFSPDGRMLAVAVNDGTIYTCDTSTWTMIPFFKGHEGATSSIVFSPDSLRIVFSSYGNTLRLWDTATGRELLVMKGHSKCVQSVAISPCGNRIASGSDDTTVRLWDAQTEECLFVLQVDGSGDSSVRTVKFSPDGKWVVSGSWEKMISIWNSETGERRAVFLSHGILASLSCSPDGRWVAVGDFDGHLQLWDADSLDPGPVLSGHTSSVTGIDFSPNGQRIASSSNDNTVRLWDVSTGTLTSVITGHAGKVNDVSFSPDGLLIASAGYDGTARLWKVSPGWSRDEQQYQTAPVLDVVYSGDGQSILSCSMDTVQQWDSSSGLPGPVLLKIPKSERSLMEFSPNGGQVAAGAIGELLQLWNVPDDVVGTWVPDCYRCMGDTTVYSSCGRWYVICSEFRHTVQLWDLKSLEQVRLTTPASSERAKIAVFSPTESCFAVGYSSGTIQLFDPHTRELLLIKKLVKKGVLSLAYSPSGLQLAVGTLSGSIYLWNLHSERPNLELKGHGDLASSITYSPCGQWISSGSRDHTVRLWHRRQDAEDERWSCAATIQGFLGTIQKIAWKPVVPLEFATVCEDGSMRVWHILGDNGSVVVNMLWGSNLRALCVSNMILEGATGLSPAQQKLLTQRGAVGGNMVSDQL